MYIPNIIEQVGRNYKVIDLPSKLFKERTIYLGEELDSEVANMIICELLSLDQISNEDINLYINSPGGSVVDGFAIRDCMENINSKVNTFGIGKCMSMGSYLVAAGTGKRFATKRTRFLVHSVSTANDYDSVAQLERSIEESRKVFEQVKTDLITFSNGKLTKELVEELTNKDSFFGVEQALEYGIIDEIL